MTVADDSTRRKRMPRAERERQMIDVAQQVFAQRGYARTSMDDIAERVGVSKPMIYEYFSSKEGLMVATLRDARTQLREATENAVAGARSAKDALERGLRAYFRFIDERKDAFAVLRHEQGLLGTTASDEVEAIRRQQTEFNMMLVRWYAPDEPTDVVEAAAEILVGACERMAAWCGRHPEATPERATELTLQVFWGGLVGLGIDEESRMG